MAVITDAERKKQHKRELQREYRARNKERINTQQRERHREQRKRAKAFLNAKPPTTPQTPFSALFTGD